MLYLDADDFVADGGLRLLIDELKWCDCDLLMFDSETQDEAGKIVESMHYKGNPQEVMTGENYLVKAEVPWVPWMTAYKKSFLNDNGIQFAQNVRFEDIDYVLKCCLLAKSVIYKPLKVISHVINPLSTVHIGRDSRKVTEQFMALDRLYDTITTYGESHAVGVKCLKGHYDFMYGTLVKRTLWRLNIKDIRKILGAYPYKGDSVSGFVGLSLEFPVIYALLAKMASPLLSAGIRIRNAIK